MDYFDELAQSLATGISRRQAIQRFAAGVTAAVVSTMLPWRTPAVAAATQNLLMFASGADVTGSGNSGGMLPSIRIGANGARVEAIQLLLRQSGADIEVDGDFGGQTDGAVRDFQNMTDNYVDGIVGPDTWGALFVTVSKGDQGDAVSAAQTLLNSNGADLEVDGDFGDQTQSAVKKFQRNHQLDDDGVVSTPTWTALVGN